MTAQTPSDTHLPARIRENLQKWEKDLQAMPEVMIEADLSGGRMVQGQVAEASVGQILATLPTMFQLLDQFEARNPGKHLGPTDLPPKFWEVYVLAREGTATFKANGMPTE